MCDIRTKRFRTTLLILTMIALSFLIFPSLMIATNLPINYCHVDTQKFNATVTNITTNEERGGSQINSTTIDAQRQKNSTERSYITCSGNVVTSEGKKTTYEKVIITDYPYVGIVHVGDVCPFDQLEPIAYSDRWTPFIGLQCTPLIIALTVIFSLLTGLLVFIFGAILIYKIRAENLANAHKQADGIATDTDFA
jgi:hypothetical protein